MILIRHFHEKVWHQQRQSWYGGGVEGKERWWISCIFLINTLENETHLSQSLAWRPPRGDIITFYHPNGLFFIQSRLSEKRPKVMIKHKMFIAIFFTQISRYCYHPVIDRLDLTQISYFNTKTHFFCCGVGRNGIFIIKIYSTKIISSVVLATLSQLLITLRESNSLAIW